MEFLLINTFEKLKIIDYAYYSNKIVKWWKKYNKNRELKKIKIIKWWKKYNNIYELKKIKKYLLDSLTESDFQELVNKSNAITKTCYGDGAGLLGGCLIDMFISKFFESKLSQYKEYHNEESDMKICDIDISQKKINGKSTIALDWSKNEIMNERKYFQVHVLIINLKTEKWWTKTPKNTNVKFTYNNTIKSGMYFVDKQFCKKYIKLKTNNKTNTLIDSKNLYLMIQRSIILNTYIEFPSVSENLIFNILNSF